VKSIRVDGNEIGDVPVDLGTGRRSVNVVLTDRVTRPSRDLETCVAEIVRRQLRRPFARSAEREEHVIRTRFPIYANMPAQKIETMRPVDAVVAELLAALAAQQAAAPDGTGARSRVPLALGAIVDARVPQVSGRRVPQGYFDFYGITSRARPPKSLVDKVPDNVTLWSYHETGGHFPAIEEPRLLVEDLRTFFRPLRSA